MEKLIDSDLIEKVIEFLGFSSSVKSLRRVSKTTNKKVINHYLVHKRGIEEGKPVESSGRGLCHLLDVARFLAMDLHVVQISPKARELVERMGNLQGLRQPQYYHELGFLNAGIYSYWNSMPADPTRGIYDCLKDYVNAQPDYYGAKAGVIRDCPYWKSSRVNGSFIVLMERPDGTVLVSKDLKSVYLVLGQAQSLGEIANVKFASNGGPPQRGKVYPKPKFHSPLIGSCISTTLINWEDKIVYDGLLMPEDSPTKSVLKKALQAYIKAVDTKTMIVAFEKKESAIPKIEVYSSGEYDQIRTELRHKLDEIRAASVAPPKYSPMMWVARRHGYTEKDNPDHLVTILGAQAGSCLMPMVQTKDLIPSVHEYFDMLYQLIVSERKGKPQSFAIDSDVRVEMLRSILKDTGIHVGYYPPPSPEEEKIMDVRRPRGQSCEVCGVLSCLDGSKLLVCSACRSVQYCCKEHQKEDWKYHKRVCNK